MGLGLLLNPWAWLAAIAMFVGTYGVGRWHQYQHDIKAHAEAKFTESESSRLRERAAHANAQRIADEKDARNRQRVDRLAAELASLRDRPDRLPEASRPACAGSTGAELSRRDSEFLTRLGERADFLRDALDACQKREALGQ